MDFLGKIYTSDDAKEILSQHYNIKPVVMNIYRAIRDDAKSRGMTQRETVKEVLREGGYHDIKEYIDKDSQNPIDQKIYNCIRHRFSSAVYVPPKNSQLLHQKLMNDTVFKKNMSL